MLASISSSLDHPWRIVFRWNAKADTFEQAAEPRDSAGLERYMGFLHGLMERGDVVMEAFRHNVIRFYENG